MIYTIWVIAEHQLRGRNAKKPFKETNQHFVAAVPLLVELKWCIPLPRLFATVFSVPQKEQKNNK